MTTAIATAIYALTAIAIVAIVQVWADLIEYIRRRMKP
jgi:hypothetical protein